MINPRTVVLLVAALGLGGCDLTAGGGPNAGAGSLAGAFTGSAAASQGSGGAAAAVTDAALGGLIGNQLGATLDENDRRLAYEAQIDALDNGAPGAPVAWRNPVSGRYGNIVPGPVYTQKGAQCRGFSHTVTISGQLETTRGTACRTAGGPWTAAG